MEHAKTSDVDRWAAYVRRRVWGQVQDLDLLVLDRGILIRGRTRAFYWKQLAQHAVMEASHLPLAANEIVVS